jgi:hypothetical protein
MAVLEARADAERAVRAAEWRSEEAEWRREMAEGERRAAARVAEVEEAAARERYGMEERCAEEYNLAVTTSKSAIDAAEKHLEEQERETAALRARGAAVEAELDQARKQVQVNIP